MEKGPLNEQQTYALELIEAACELMNWGIILPTDSESDVHYMIIGSQDGLEMAKRRLFGDLQ